MFIYRTDFSLFSYFLRLFFQWLRHWATNIQTKCLNIVFFTYIILVGFPQFQPCQESLRKPCSTVSRKKIWTVCFFECIVFALLWSKLLKWVVSVHYEIIMSQGKSSKITQNNDHETMGFQINQTLKYWKCWITFPKLFFLFFFKSTFVAFCSYLIIHFLYRYTDVWLKLFLTSKSLLQNTRGKEIQVTTYLSSLTEIFWQMEKETLIPRISV